MPPSGPTVAEKSGVTVVAPPSVEPPSCEDVPLVLLPCEDVVPPWEEVEVVPCEDVEGACEEAEPVPCEDVPLVLVLVPCEGVALVLATCKDVAPPPCED